MGFGKGSAGVGGTFFQLLIVLFMELFGVGFGQLIGAISPSMQVCRTPLLAEQLFIHHALDCSAVQSLHGSGSEHLLRCHDSLSHHGEVLAIVAVSIGPVHAHAQHHASNRVAVSEAIIALIV